jgi:hypothetical protein
MALEASAVGGGLIAVWDGESSGTLNMIEHAKSLGLSLFVFPVLRRL